MNQPMRASLLFFSFLICTTSIGFGQSEAYYNQTEFGVMYGSSENQWTGQDDNRINFSMITFHGVKFSKHHAAGFSVGLDRYEELSILPIALGWRGFLGNDRGVRLVGGLDLGGGSTLLEKSEETEWGKSWLEGGVMASPSVGALFSGKQGKTTLSLTVAYKRQELSSFQGSYDRVGIASPSPSSKLPPGYSSLTETNYIFHSLVLRAGLSF